MALQVHQVWAQHGLVPGLEACVDLPGGYNMMVMDFLGEGWAMLHELFTKSKSASYSNEDRASCMTAVQTSLQTMHNVVVSHGDNDHDGSSTTHRVGHHG